MAVEQTDRVANTVAVAIGGVKKGRIKPLRIPRPQGILEADAERREKKRSARRWVKFAKALRRSM